jgi:hypothetical protein
MSFKGRFSRLLVAQGNGSWDIVVSTSGTSALCQL